MANIEKASLDGTNYDLGPDAIDASNITGTLPIANGGTGQTTKAAVRNTLGLGNTTGALPIANGGTGQTTAIDAVNALLAGVNIYTATDTTSSTSTLYKRWKADGPGFVIAAVECLTSATSDWGNHECWIFFAGSEASYVNMRTDVGYNGWQGASTVSFKKVASGELISLETRTSRTGSSTVRRRYRVAAFGCTLTAQ